MPPVDEQTQLRFFSYRRVWLFAAFLATSMMLANLDRDFPEAAVMGVSFGLAVGAAGSLYAWFLRAQHEAGQALRKGPPGP